MTIVKRAIKIKRNREVSSVETMELAYDSETHEINDLSGQADFLSFKGENLYKSFMELNRLLKSKGFVALCNGARKDVSLSGALAEVAGGAMLYVDSREAGYPTVYIFDECDDILIQ